MTSMSKWAAGLVVLAVAAFAAGCGGADKGKEKGGDKAAKGKDRGKEGKGKEGHAHDGPHGGPLAEWGNEEYHAEFTVDRKKKEVRVYIYGPDHHDFKPAPIKAEKVTLSVKKPEFEVDLKPEKQKGDPEGAASVFVGKHDHFGKEQPFEGTLSAEFGGKQYSGDFKQKRGKK